MQDALLFKNVKVAFSDVGKGTAVVLLHGLLENSTMWQPFIPEISKRNRVITIDLLGHGRSECLGSVHSMELFAEAVAAVLKQISIDKCILIGHSLGGYIALAFAEKYPEKIKGLCLMNSTSYEDDEDRKLLRGFTNKVAKKNFEKMVRMSVSNLFHQENVPLFKNEIEMIKKEALRTSLQGFLATQEGMKLRPNRSNILKTHHFKKLMIFGENDPMFEIETLIQEAKTTMTDFVVFPGGHMSHIENKEALLALFKKFIKNCNS